MRQGYLRVAVAQIRDLNSQQNSSIAVSLLGIAFLVAALAQSHQVFRMVELDVHPTGRPVFSRVCQMLRAGATLF